MPEQQLFKALADPTRRQILKTLRGGSQTAGQLAAQFPISRASLSHHFNILKTADLVRTRRDGQHILYSLNTSVVEALTQMLFEVIGPNVESAAAIESAAALPPSEVTGTTGQNDQVADKASAAELSGDLT